MKKEKVYIKLDLEKYDLHINGNSLSKTIGGYKGHNTRLKNKIKEIESNIAILETKTTIEEYNMLYASVPRIETKKHFRIFN